MIKIIRSIINLMSNNKQTEVFNSQITDNELKFGLYLFNDSNNFNIITYYKGEIINVGETLKFTPRKYEMIAKMLKEIYGDNADIYPELVINDKDILK